MSQVVAKELSSFGHVSQVVAKKLQSVHLAEFTGTLLEGLTDSQSHSSSGACVVLNSIVRIRGQELRREVTCTVARNKTGIMPVYLASVCA